MRLRTLVAWTAAGNAVYVGSQYLFLIVIAKLLDLGRVGDYSIAIAIAAPAFMLAQLGMRQLQITDAKRDFAFSDFAWTRLLATLAAVAVVIGGALATGTRITHLLLAVCAWKATESISDIVHGELQRHERMDAISIALGLKAALGLGAMIAVVWTTLSLTIGVLAVGAVHIATLALYELPMLRRVHGPLGGRLSTNAIGRIVRTCWPLAVGGGLQAYTANIPRYALTLAAGNEAVALYAIAYSPLSLIGMVATALQQATMPRAAVHWHAGDRGAFRLVMLRVTQLQILAGAAGAAAFALAGPWIMTVVYEPRCAAVAPLSTLLLTTLTVSYLSTPGGTALAVARAYGPLTLNVALAAAVQGLLCWVWRDGLTVAGAVWTDVAKFAVSTAFFVIVGWWAMRRMPTTTGAARA